MSIGTVKINSIYSVTIGGNDVGNLAAAFANWAAADTDGELFKALENYLAANAVKVAEAEAEVVKAASDKIGYEVATSQAVKDSIDASAAKVTAMETENATLKAKITELESSIPNAAGIDWDGLATALKTNSIILEAEKSKESAFALVLLGSSIGTPKLFWQRWDELLLTLNQNVETYRKEEAVSLFAKFGLEVLNG